MTVRITTVGDASVGARGVRLYQDPDGDSLSDYRERQRWTIPYGYGDSFTLDPNAPDTDGDSLDDQEEVSLGPAVSNPASPLEVRYAESNPGEVDTDGDALDDSEERAEGTNAFFADTDYDYLGDATEVNEVGTDPLKRDTDGDYLLDGQEGDVAVSIGGQLGEMDYANPLAADTDGDGVSDFAELGGSPNKYGVYELDSSPTEEVLHCESEQEYSEGDD